VNHTAAVLAGMVMTISGSTIHSFTPVIVVQAPSGPSLLVTGWILASLDRDAARRFSILFSMDRQGRRLSLIAEIGGTDGGSDNRL
jgi:hypothetical protein